MIFKVKTCLRPLGLENFEKNVSFSHSWTVTARRGEFVTERNRCHSLGARHSEHLTRCGE